MIQVLLFHFIFFKRIRFGYFESSSLLKLLNTLQSMMEHSIRSCSMFNVQQISLHYYCSFAIWTIRMNLNANNLFLIWPWIVDCGLWTVDQRTIVYRRWIYLGNPFSRTMNGGWKLIKELIDEIVTDSETNQRTKNHHKLNSISTDFDQITLPRTGK